MRNKKIIISGCKMISFFFLFVYSFSFCSFKKKELSQIESKYSIDLDGKHESSILLSSYFKAPKTIILETNNDCLIGHINKLQSFDGYIFILDKSIAKSLLIFDRNGRFIRKIGRLGQGPGEYVQLDDFTLDTENGFIFLLDYGERLHKYRFDGTFIQTITPKVQNANINFIQCYNKRLYLSVLPYKPTLDDFMLMETDLYDGKILAKSLPYKYNKGWTTPIFMGHSFFVSRLNGPPLYVQMFMDFIVSVGENSIPYIELKSRNLVTERDIRNISNTNGGAKAIYNNLSSYFQESLKIFDVHSYIENDEIILFNYQQGFTNVNTVIFHKKTRSVELSKYIKRDLIFQNNDNRFFGGFAFSDSDGAYEILITLAIERFQESIRNNEVVPELDRLDDLLKLEDDANPVIFYYEFK